MRRLVAAIGCVALIGGGMLFAAPSAHAGVGNCTSMYVSALDDGNNATTLGYHALYGYCLANDVDTCLGRGGTPVDLAGCLID